METLTSKLQRLLNGRAVGKGRLPPAGDRPVIPGGVGIGERGAGTGGFPDSLSEVAGARAYYPPNNVTDASGLFTIVQNKVQATTFLTNDGRSLAVIYQKQ